MDIPKTLPQFTQTRAFICVIGAKYGLIYFVSNGVVLMLDELEQELPYIDEKRGFFLRSEYGERLGIWEDSEELYIEIEKRFLRKIRDELNIYIHVLEPRTVYVFAPTYIHKKLLSELKSIPEVTFVVVEKGNYTKKSPLELLSIIDKKMNDEPDYTSPSSVDTQSKNAKEKKKLLEKFKLAKGY